MPRKTTILIVILALVTAGLLFMALRSSSPLEMNTTPSTGQATRNVEKTAKLFFAPSTVSASSGSASTVDVMLDSGGADITGVQLVLSFDPKAVTSFTITAPQGENTYFGTNPVILLNNVDLSSGKAEFSIATSLTTGPKTGNGKVATVNFVLNRNSILSSSVVAFLNTTTVVKHGESESVLKETTPLTIQLKP